MYTIMQESFGNTLADQYAMNAAAAEAGWHDKVHRICRRINVVKETLASHRLSGREARLATKLILEIERSVDALGDMAAPELETDQVSETPTWSRIDSQLDDLALLCEQLTMAVHSPVR
jgi:hypothetical protein